MNFTELKKKLNYDLYSNYYIFELSFENCLIDDQAADAMSATHTV